jgi:hypothetical protein
MGALRRGQRQVPDQKRDEGSVHLRLKTDGLTRAVCSRPAIITPPETPAMNMPMRRFVRGSRLVRTASAV